MLSLTCFKAKLEPIEEQALEPLKIGPWGPPRFRSRLAREDAVHVQYSHATSGLLKVRKSSAGNQNDIVVFGS